MKAVYKTIQNINKDHPEFRNLGKYVSTREFMKY